MGKSVQHLQKLMLLCDWPFAYYVYMSGHFYFSFLKLPYKPLVWIPCFLDMQSGQELKHDTASTQLLRRGKKTIVRDKEISAFGHTSIYDFTTKRRSFQRQWIHQPDKTPASQNISTQNRQAKTSWSILLQGHFNSI